MRPVSEATETNEVSPLRDELRGKAPEQHAQSDAEHDWSRKGESDRRERAAQRGHRGQLDANFVARRVVGRNLSHSVLSRKAAELALDLGRNFTRSAHGGARATEPA